MIDWCFVIFGCMQCKQYRKKGKGKSLSETQGQRRHCSAMANDLDDALHSKGGGHLNSTIRNRFEVKVYFTDW